MIRFLIRGLLRDKSRSVLPILVVTAGVMVSVWAQAYVTGFMGDTLELNARFHYGHVKIMTRAYAEEADQIPHELALFGTAELKASLERTFPDMTWSARIPFGGLVDAPDEEGETKAQGPAMGIALDLLSEDTAEIGRLGLDRALARGGLPERPGQALLGEEFSQRLDVRPGDTVTLIGSDAHGAMVMHNFEVAGTLTFGMEALDRGSLLIDIEDARKVLDLPDAASEILGFLPDGFFDRRAAAAVAETFERTRAGEPDPFAPTMRTLSQQGGMGTYVELMSVWNWYITMVFVFAMALVLWNAGLLGGLRRYGEIGVRLAMGETKTHVYGSMIAESVFVGLAGSVSGTLLGLAVSWWMQEYGLDISGMMEGAAVMMPTVIRARITPVSYVVGFVPGVLSTVTGTMLSGIGIFRRQTARLFKELEA